MLGVHIDPLTMEETVARCSGFVRRGIPAHHVCINAGKAVLMADQPRLLEVVRNCDLISADGQAVVWASALLGNRLPERVAGIDLMGRLLEEASREGWPVFFLGA